MWGIALLSTSRLLHRIMPGRMCSAQTRNSCLGPLARQAGKSAGARLLQVAVRMRPPNAQELARADPQALFVNPNDYRQIQLVVPGA